MRSFYAILIKSEYFPRQEHYFYIKSNLHIRSLHEAVNAFNGHELVHGYLFFSCSRADGNLSTR